MPYIGVQPVDQASMLLTQGTFSSSTSTLNVPSGYTPGNIAVYVNGLRLKTSDYTASDGFTISFTESFSVGSEYVVEEFRSFEIADVGGVLVDTSTGTQTIPDALDQRVIYVDTIADLQALTTSGLVDGQQVQVKEYYAGKGGGGGLLHFDQSDTTTADNGGTVFVGVDGARWKRISAKTPEDWGAVGDGVADDTDALAAWWAHGTKEKLIARGEYVVSGTDQFSATVATESFVVDGEGANISVSQARAYLFRVNVTGNAQVDISGLLITGNNNVARPLEVYSSNGSTARYVRVENVAAIGVFGNDGLGFSSSAIGIRIACESIFVEVSKCIVNGVNREYVNPGIVSSVGISVAEVVGTCLIHGNRILDVQSPLNDVDADGLSVFSHDRLLAGRQRVNVRIYNNTFSDCKGRFVKLQTTEAYVYNNRFESYTKDIYSGFRGIDCQFGGCRIESNYWNLLNVASENGDMAFQFAYIQPKSEGNWESRTVVADNFIVLERTIRYLCFVSMLEGRAHIEVRDNYIKATQSIDFITETLTRIDGDVAGVTSVHLSVNNNTYPGDRDYLVILDATYSSNATAADKASFEVADNKNTKTPTSPVNSLFLVVGGGTPHLGVIKIQGNYPGALAGNRINAKSLNINNILPGSSFYYGTDGGTADGLLGVPRSYVRFVHVYNEGQEQTLLNNNTSAFAKRKQGAATWYEYTGTAL